MSNNPFVGFDPFQKQDREHPYGEDAHLDSDSILERYGDVDTGDNTEEHEQDEGTNYGEGVTNLDESDGTKEKSSGCSTVSTMPSWLIAILGFLGVRRKDNERR